MLVVDGEWGEQKKRSTSDVSTAMDFSRDQETEYIAHFEKEIRNLLEEISITLCNPRIYSDKKPKLSQVKLKPAHQFTPSSSKGTSATSPHFRTPNSLKMHRRLCLPQVLLCVFRFPLYPATSPAYSPEAVGRRSSHLCYISYFPSQMNQSPKQCHQSWPILVGSAICQQTSRIPTLDLFENLLTG